MPDNIWNDEPATEDKLDRALFAQALAYVGTTCDTPLVIGVYGTWGVGKTSLMRLIQSRIDREGSARTVWFDAWQHQFDENPAVALLHTMVDDLELGEEGRKLLYVIASALGGAALKATKLITTKDIQDIEKQYEEERFQIREKQVRLRKHFADLLGRATKNGQIRLVFFIDDLDRCVPEQVLRVLEALKLFLNMPGCVYLLGVDRLALEGSIRRQYADAEVNEVSYLDKIVQLPFTIPPISDVAVRQYIESLLPADLSDVLPLLIEGLADNPRNIKRFVNSFLLNHELAKLTIRRDYRPTVLAAILLLQIRSPEAFKQVVRDPTMLVDVHRDDVVLQRVPTVIVETLALPVRVDTTSLGPYIYLSKLVGPRGGESYDVLLNGIGGQLNGRAQVIELVRELNPALGLKDANDLVASLPVTVATSLSYEDANELATKFWAVGATVLFKQI